MIRNLTDALTRSWSGAAWHGPSLRSALSGVRAVTAAARPAPNIHSIWELALHIAAWTDAALRGIDGGSVRVSARANFPAVTDTSEKAWRDTVAALKVSHFRLVARVRTLSDADLKKPVAGKRYTVGFLLGGILQHHAYHGGQISLLKKLQ